MNWLDIVMLCLAGIGFVKGLFDGVIKQVVSLIALLGGIFFCAKAATWVRQYLISLNWFPEEGITILSYVVGFLMIFGLVWLAGEIVNRIVGVTPLSILNHLAGGLFGICMMALFLSLLLNAFNLIDKGSVLISRQAKVESRFYYPIEQIIPTIFPHNLFTGGEDMEKEE